MTNNNPATVATVDRFDILSIDAWREVEGGWTWNDSRRCRSGVDFDAIVTRPGEDYSTQRRRAPRRLLAWCRSNDILTAQSAGLLSVEYDADGNGGAVIIRRGTGEPLIAFVHNHQDTQDGAEDTGAE